MKWNQPKVPNPGPKWVRRFALLPKYCHPLWNGCGSHVWFEKVWGQRYERLNGTVVYVAMCNDCMDKPRRKNG